MSSSRSGQWTRISVAFISPPPPRTLPLPESTAPSRPGPPCTSILRSLTVPPHPHPARSFLAIVSITDTGRCVAKSSTTITLFPPRWAFSFLKTTRPIFHNRSPPFPGAVPAAPAGKSGSRIPANASPSPPKGACVPPVSIRFFGSGRILDIQLFAAIRGAGLLTSTRALTFSRSAPCSFKLAVRSLISCCCCASIP